MLQFSLRLCFVWFFYCHQIGALQITDTDIKMAFSIALDKVTKQKENLHYNEYYFGNKYENQTGPYAAYLQKYSRYLEYEKMQDVFEEATRILKERFNLTPHEVLELEEIDLRDKIPEIMDKCLPAFDDIKCDEYYPYRTMDGSCNNILHPTWGKSFECTNRMFHPVYSDGVSALRKSVNGNELPNPRYVSLNIDPHLERDFHSTTFTIAFMQFGQLLAHEMDFCPKPFPRPIGSNVECSSDEKKPVECAPINITNTDPFYSKYGINCFGNSRSHTCVTCKLGPRNQVNQLTSFIDGSVVYGMHKEMADQLRTLDGTGTLKHDNYIDVGELHMQSSEAIDDHCSFQRKPINCFQSGDIQSNQHPMLSSMAVMLMRHHNTIARKLKSLNNCWQEEKVFQETRRIVAAQLQMITYNEFLPKLVGKYNMEKYGLFVNWGLSYTKYNPSINPTINVEFSTSAFRFGHSIIMDVIPRIFHNTVDPIRLMNTFFQPYELYSPSHLEAIFKGMAFSSSHEFDRFIVSDVTNQLFRYPGNDTGMDIVSFDVFRERDHGMPPYVDVVKFCLNIDIKTFEDLVPLLGKENAMVYKMVYEHVEDIELLSAAYSEIHVEDGLVGPTLSCIISMQFQMLKYGDRFYFEHGNQIGSFNPVQLLEIKNTRLARIICDSVKIPNIQEFIMFQPSEWNPVTFCESLPHVELSVFDDPLC